MRFLAKDDPVERSEMIAHMTDHSQTIPHSDEARKVSCCQNSRSLGSERMPWGNFFSLLLERNSTSTFERLSRTSS